MSKPIPFPKDTVERMDQLLADNALSARERDRVRTIRLLAQNWEAKDVADAMSCSRSTVYRRKAEYLSEGGAALKTDEWGGRRNELMSLAEETEFIAGFERAARNGELVNAKAMIQALSERVGRRVGRVTLYEMLQRHGWRKAVPRPGHPKADPERREAFKETSQT